jgi:hypothetical protein
MSRRYLSAQKDIKLWDFPDTDPPLRPVDEFIQYVLDGLFGPCDPSGSDFAPEYLRPWEV